MKKLILITFTISFLALIGCQNDEIITPKNDSINKETLMGGEEKGGGTVGTLPAPSVVIEIPAAYESNPFQYLIEKSLIPDPEAPTNNLGITCGCVTFLNGTAHVNCTGGIIRGIPASLKDCYIVQERKIVCGKWDLRPNCIICCVVYVARCRNNTIVADFGYQIFCDETDPTLP